MAVRDGVPPGAQALDLLADDHIAAAMKLIDQAVERLERLEERLRSAERRVLEQSHAHGFTDHKIAQPFQAMRLADETKAAAIEVGAILDLLGRKGGN